MGCGCGGKRNMTKQIRNTVPPKGIINSAKIEQPNKTLEQIVKEKRIIETKKRENLIRALKVP